MRFAILACASAGALLGLAGEAQAASFITDYNVFVLGDYVGQYSDVEGRVAAGGNLGLTGFGVGWGLDASADGTNAVVAGGRLDYTNGQVFHGNVVYGSAGTVTATVAHGTKSVGAPIDFAAAGTQLKGISAALATRATTGSAVYQYGGFTLTGTSAGLNVFRVDGSQLASANNFTLSAPTGASVLIDVTGAASGLRNLGMSLTGVSAGNVLFNFADATGLQIGGAGVMGSILAPKAAVGFSNGQINGELIAGSLSGSGEAHNVRYAGGLLDAPGPVPEPATWASMIAGFALVGAALRRRRSAIAATG